MRVEANSTRIEANKGILFCALQMGWADGLANIVGLQVMDAS